MTTTNPRTNAPQPAGAVSIDDWLDLDTPVLFRFFEGSRRLVDRPDGHEDAGAGGHT